MKKFILLLVIAVLLAGCTGKRTKELASQTYQTEENKEFNQDERIKELTSDIKKLEKELNETLEKYQKVGNYHRALGIKMMHYKMYFKAYEHFTTALDFYPNSEMLHYYRGVAAGQYALSRDLEVEKLDFLNRAKTSYEYSIQLNSGFVKGLYALSILYIYEFDMAEEAKPLLDRLISISTREFDAMLIRGLLYEKDQEWNAALDLYDRVLDMSKKDDHIVRAETGRDRVLSVITGE